eukprot:TRINITY_DN14690_c0_g1_i1.p2 TRINITY_DN14690_c0_g1~~TRINITY_DN14690_c0_g1_i1.p2  ORF type:complete len:203 (+),score=36.28 TRINITY_DN14690_c0_g1_i1:135-743(+)
MKRLRMIPKRGNKGTKGHLKVSGKLTCFMRNNNKQSTKEMIVKGKQNARCNLLDHRKEVVNTDANIKNKSMYNLLVCFSSCSSLYLSINTQKQTKAKAKSVPIETMSANSSKGKKKESKLARTPITIVEMIGESNLLLILDINEGSKRSLDIEKNNLLAPSILVRTDVNKAKKAPIPISVDIHLRPRELNAVDSGELMSISL